MIQPDILQFKVSVGGKEIGKLKYDGTTLKASGDSNKILNILEDCKHPTQSIKEFLQHAPRRFHGHLKFEKI